MLLFCVNQQINEQPYTFKTTGIRVYTFEETLYHVFHFWRESVDDFLSEGMISWVGELGHSYLAARMKDLAVKEPFTKRVLDFLKLVDYFSQDDLSRLKEQLEAWETRREWEKLKERADYFVTRGEPSKAIPLYKQALVSEENVSLLNNIAVAYMQVGSHMDALRALTRALTIAPANHDLLFHYIEAAILSGEYPNARKALEIAKSKVPDSADIPFLTGLMAWGQKDYTGALQYFDKALEIDDTVPHYIYMAADVHLAMRRYDKALAILARLGARDSAYFTKEAEIYAASGDIPGAIKAMENAVNVSASPDAALYAKLAGYYRRDYEPRRAEEAIQKALLIDPEHDMVRLENARIKKGLGRTREYQAALNDVLGSFKDRYRGEV